MNHDIARAQVLSGHLSNTLSGSIAAQTEAVVLQHQLQAAQALAAKWEHACLNHLTPEDFERVKAAVSPGEGEGAR